MEIKGSVQSVIFYNPDNGFSVLEIETEGGVITAVGCVPEVSEGESLALEGKWTSSAKYGDRLFSRLSSRLNLVLELKGSDLRKS